MSDKKKIIIVTSMIFVLFTWIDMFVFDFGNYSPSRGSVYIGILGPMIYIIVILFSSKVKNKSHKFYLPSDCKNKSTFIILFVCILLSAYPSFIMFANRHDLYVYVPKIFKEFSYFLRNVLGFDFY